MPAHPKKLHKPYRIHHAGLFFAGVLLVIGAAFYGGYALGGSNVTVVSTTENNAKVASTFGEVRSSLGFAFKYDTSVFRASGVGGTLDKSEVLTEVNLQPRSSAVKGSDALSALKIKADASSAQFDQYKKKTRQNDEKTVLVDYFAPVSDKDFTVEKTRQSEQSVGGVNMQKAVYVKKPRFAADAKPIYQVVWAGLVDGRPVRLSVENLVNDDKIPAIYSQVFDTLRLGADASSSVLAARDDKEKSFDMNRVSPAVVKIYHFVCGVLVVDNVPQGGDTCDGGGGSGFLVSADGYIATSGHVVVMSPADILVSVLLNNPALLQQFTAAAGLSPSESAQQDVVASVLARIYDLPPEKLRLDGMREATFAALGSEPIEVSTPEDIKKIMGRADTDYIKKADIVGVNYQAKDLLVIEQQGEAGFSASDVALIKVNVKSAPFIGLADSGKIQQNAPISLIGFPADAENQLTANDIIAPSITNGAISSIRKANGSPSLLFQSDADASEGNSGGPAIGEDGKAFGLVTYRFKSGNEADAAKSYIRDIGDFKDLVKSENITLAAKSPTQTAWEKGLELYKSERYSKSIREFSKVKQNYPAHRLADSYISGAEQAIKEGRDKKDPPYALVGAVLAGLIGVFAAIVAVRMMARHKKAHTDYKNDHLNTQKIINPAG